MEKKDLAVLVIEDDEDVASLLHTILKRSGFNPDLAESEAEGMNLVSRKSFDIIFSDTYCNGIPYGPRIVLKARELGQNPKIIANSGDANGIAEWKDLNPDYFFRKPLDIREIRVTMDSIYESVKKTKAESS